jgi:hypothetical protein
MSTELIYSDATKLAELIRTREVLDVYPRAPRRRIARHSQSEVDSSSATVGDECP